jgi:hypothetical protein
MPGSFSVLFVFFFVCVCLLCCGKVSCVWCKETKTVMAEGGRQLDRWKERLDQPLWSGRSTRELAMARGLKKDRWREW